MKKTLIALVAMASVAVGDTLVSSTTLTYDPNNKYVADDSTLYDYLDKVVNVGGTLTFSMGLNWNGSTATDYQTILHIGANSTGITMAVNGTKNLIFGENNDYSVGHELTSGTLSRGDNTVVFTLTGKETGTAAASITLNGTTYDMPDMVWSTMAWSDTPAERNKYSIGCQAPGYTGKALTHISIIGNTITVSYIPEPATATLSLLALAGLAARRRRR